MYHSRCLRQWVSRHETCPTCRQNVPAMPTASELATRHLQQVRTQYRVFERRQSREALNRALATLARLQAQAERAHAIELASRQAQAERANAEELASRQPTANAPPPQQELDTGFINFLVNYMRQLPRSEQLRLATLFIVVAAIMLNTPDLDTLLRRITEDIVRSNSERDQLLSMLFRRTHEDE